MSLAERVYLILKQRGLRAKIYARLYFFLRRPHWMASLWVRGAREWSTKMYDEQLERDGFL